jgi:hypothetical protein
VRLNNGERVRVVVYVVSDDPKAVVVPGAPIEQRYQWNSVTRAHCKKGCSGPILRAIQRFGRQGRCARHSVRHNVAARCSTCLADLLQMLRCAPSRF